MTLPPDPGRGVARRLAGAVVATGLIVVAARAASAAKELVVAARFGTSDEIDAFLVAYAVPSFFVNVLAGAMAAAFVPALIRSRESERAEGLLGSALALATATLLVAGLALVLVGPPALRLLAPGFDAVKLAVTRELYLLLLPTLLLAGLASLYGAVLNAGERYALVAATPALTPLVTILALLVVPALGVRALVLGVVAGQTLEMLALGIGVRARGDRALPRWAGMSPPLRAAVGQYLPLVAAALIDSSAPLVDQAIASLLGSGSIAALGYGNRLVALVMGVVGATVVTVLFPHFATLAARRDVVAFQRHLGRAVAAVVALTVPVSAAFVLLGTPITRLVFQRGAFDPATTATVAQVQAMYALQIPVHLAGILGVRALSALSAGSAIVKISVVNLVVNATADYALMRLMGVPGIALSTSLVYGLSALLIFIAVRRRLRELARPT